MQSHHHEFFNKNNRVKFFDRGDCQAKLQYLVYDNNTSSNLHQARLYMVWLSIVNMDSEFGKDVFGIFRQGQDGRLVLVETATVSVEGACGFFDRLSLNGSVDSEWYMGDECGHYFMDPRFRDLLDIDKVDVSEELMVIPEHTCDNILKIFRNDLTSFWRRMEDVRVPFISL
jgi:hypothetical protein